VVADDEKTQKYAMLFSRRLFDCIIFISASKGQAAAAVATIASGSKI
jgi:hypothetical protein